MGLFLHRCSLQCWASFYLLPTCGSDIATEQIKYLTWVCACCSRFENDKAVLVENYEDEEEQIYQVEQSHCCGWSTSVQRLVTFRERHMGFRCSPLMVILPTLCHCVHPCCVILCRFKSFSHILISISLSSSKFYSFIYLFYFFCL